MLKRAIKTEKIEFVDYLYIKNGQKNAKNQAQLFLSYLLVLFAGLFCFYFVGLVVEVGIMVSLAISNVISIA